MATVKGALDHHECPLSSVDLEENRCSDDGKTTDHDECLPGSSAGGQHLISQPGNIVGYEAYRKGLATTFSADEERKVRWKIDLIVLPIFFVTQCLQFLDKTALNYANLFGYQESLSLHGNQFNYLSAMVYAGYFFGQYPCLSLVARYPAQRVLGVSCLLWGLVVILLTQCHTYPSAMAARFILGLFESSVTPGLTLMTGFWYKRSEIPLRQSIWYSSLGVAGIIGSNMSTGIDTLPPNMQTKKWQILFYILGGVTVVWSAILYFVLADAPSNAKWLNQRQQIIATTRVAGNQVGIKNKHFNIAQARLALCDPKMWLLFLSFWAAAIPNGVINSFSTIIIRDLGFSTYRTTQLKSVGDATQVISLLIGGTIILNVPNSRLAVASVANILCTVSAGLMAYLPRSNVWGRLVCFWLVNSQSVGFTVGLVTINSNMGGYTHRSMASALIFSAYCWGNFAGPFVVKQDQAPTFPTATKGLLAGYSAKSICQLALLIYMFTVNRSRQKRYGPPNETASKEAGMLDQTEFENKEFRYVL